jgi:hypothetical protein
MREYHPLTLTLSESQDGRIVAVGEFGRVDVPTANGRIYPRRILEREIKRLERAMMHRQLFGELDHPDDGRTMLGRVSHIITKMTIESDGRVMGHLEVLKTRNGRELQALVDSGVKLGVSSRGLGSVQKNQQGYHVVQEDFKLLTYDVVADPAMSSALPDFSYHGEGTHFAESEVEVEVDVEVNVNTDGKGKGEEEGEGEEGADVKDSEETQGDDKSSGDSSSSEPNATVAPPASHIVPLKPVMPEPVKTEGVIPHSLAALAALYPDIHASLVAEAERNVTIKLNRVYEEKLRVAVENEQAKVAENLERVLYTATQEERERVMEELEAEGDMRLVYKSLLRQIAPLAEGMTPSDLSEAERAGWKEQLEAANADIFKLEERKAALKEDLRKVSVAYILASNVHRVRKEHTDHFLSMVGPYKNYDTLDEYRKRVEVVMNEFASNGRLYDEPSVYEGFIEDLKGKLSDCNERLNAASIKIKRLNGAHAELQEAKNLLRALRQELEESKQREDAARDLIRESRDQIKMLKAQLTEAEQQAIGYQKAKAVVMESRNELARLNETVEDLHLDLARYKAVIGSANPNALLEHLKMAKSEREIGPLIESYNKTYRKPVAGPTKKDSNSTLLSESTQQRIRDVASGKTQEKVEERKENLHGNLRESANNGGSPLLPGFTLDRYNQMFAHK